MASRTARRHGTKGTYKRKKDREYQQQTKERVRHKKVNKLMLWMAGQLRYYHHG